MTGTASRRPLRAAALCAAWAVAWIIASDAGARAADGPVLRGAVLDALGAPLAGGEVVEASARRVRR